VPWRKVEIDAPLHPAAYCWFTEGFDTRDLKEAKALREELATQSRSLAL
jgi:hypothetical protein